jgi:hypothetical protein
MSRQEILTLGASGNRFCSLSNAAILFPLGNGVAAMKDLQAQLENLRADAAECALIRDLATPKETRAFHEAGRSPDGSRIRS